MKPGAVLSMIVYLREKKGDDGIRRAVAEALWKEYRRTRYAPTKRKAKK